LYISAEGEGKEERGRKRRQSGDSDEGLVCRVTATGFPGEQTGTTRWLLKDRYAGKKLPELMSRVK
jgi:hypothetical protein